MGFAAGHFVRCGEWFEHDQFSKKGAENIIISFTFWKKGGGNITISFTFWKKGFQKLLKPRIIFLLEYSAVEYSAVDIQISTNDNAWPL